jgi:hypothetical protein
MEAGASDERVIAAIVGSDEYFRNRGSDNSNWLNSAFQDILLRAPDQGARDFFLQQLAAGRPRFDIALDLTHSDEYRELLVGQLFAKYLRRPGTPQEIQQFASQLRQGASDEDIVNTILASEEYFEGRAQGAVTLSDKDANWIRGVYVDALVRAAQDSEVEFWVLGTLSPGEQAARNAVATNVTDSTEYRSRLVGLIYASYLGRSPSTAETNLWLSLLYQPTPGPGFASSLERFMASVLSSGEYFSQQRVPDPLDPSRTIATGDQWARELYNDLLKRLPQAGELDTTLSEYLDAFAQQRLDIATAISTSDEYNRVLVTDHFQTYLRRSPSPSELDFFVNALKGAFPGAPRATSQDVIAVLVSNWPQPPGTQDEYFQNPNLGGSNNSRWLNQVYRDFLGRDRDPSSQVYLDRLNAATPQQLPNERKAIADELLRSDEYLGRLIGGIGVGLYDRFFNRVPDAAELQFWISEMRLPPNGPGVREEQVIAAMLASNEYFLIPHPFP